MPLRLRLRDGGGGPPITLKDDSLAVIGKELMTNVFCELPQHTSKAQRPENVTFISGSLPGSPSEILHPVFWDLNDTAQKEPHHVISAPPAGQRPLGA